MIQNLETCPQVGVTNEVERLQDANQCEHAIRLVTKGKKSQVETRSGILKLAPIEMTKETCPQVDR